DDDTCDRINRLISAVLILLLGLVVSARQCLGEAIYCWCPEICATNHEKYANLMCWVDDTYFVPFLDRIPHPEEVRQRKITYYQWVPIILMLQALMFLAPWIVWRVLAGRVGIKLGNIIQAACKSQLSDKCEEREAAHKFAFYLLNRFHHHQTSPPLPHLISPSKCFSNTCHFFKPHLFTSYIVVKILYLTNSVGQLFLLDKFLGVEFYTFGYHVLTFLIANRQWTPTDRFPHVTMCDFRIRQSTNVHQYTVQCVLPINIFNEKVFTVIWFWLVIVAAITLCSLLGWVWSMTLGTTISEYVKENLSVLNMYIAEDQVELQSLEIFAKKYIGRDGMFILKLVAKNSGELVAAELLQSLWAHY
ncbi:hypothetical protein HELRODRAFT_132794, partial [Helobdella robusta]|uniref:Innexin n=1 Tax=Helobdella robusta TaxID=6412 RepID=T1EHZ6_HELRO